MDIINSFLSLVDPKMISNFATIIFCTFCASVVLTMIWFIMALGSLTTAIDRFIDKYLPASEDTQNAVTGHKPISRWWNKLTAKRQDSLK